MSDPIFLNKWYRIPAVTYYKYVLDDYDFGLLYLAVQTINEKDWMEREPYKWVLKDYTVDRLGVVGDSWISAYPVSRIPDGIPFTTSDLGKIVYEMTLHLAPTDSSNTYGLQYHDWSNL